MAAIVILLCGFTPSLNAQKNSVGLGASVFGSRGFFDLFMSAELRYTRLLSDNAGFQASLLVGGDSGFGIGFHGGVYIKLLDFLHLYSVTGAHFSENGNTVLILGGGGELTLWILGIYFGLGTNIPLSTDSGLNSYLNVGLAVHF
jgi:hypothetical protein